MLLCLLRALVGSLLQENLLVKNNGIPPPLLLFHALAPSVLRGIGLSAKICSGARNVLLLGLAWFSIIVLVDHVCSTSVVDVNLLYTVLNNKVGDVQWIIGAPMFGLGFIYRECYLEYVLAVWPCIGISALAVDAWMGPGDGEYLHPFSQSFPPSF
ncbi:unnamed protein product [Lactuca saligna]|uniref:Uncharacterized protein n=1 Tax=Lactuca saligna TaxID=75948 RepID=A0AA35YV88_LACSI|nr:unnamed protein product [Lactuca saligna]